MKFNCAYKNLTILIQIGKIQDSVPYLVGKPGVGKSDMVKLLCKNLGLKLIDCRLSLIDSVEIRGIPRVFEEEGVCKWYPPEFIPFKGIKKFNTDEYKKGGILFLDEMNRAKPDVLQAIFQLVRDRKVGDFELLDNWYIIAAGNLGQEDFTDVVEFDSALKDRLVFIEVEENIEEWTDWAKKENVYWPIISYLNAHPQNLHTLTENKEDKKFITPRTWVRLSNIIKNRPKEMSEIEVIESIGRCVINGLYPSFRDYVEKLNHLSVKDVLEKYNENKFKLKNLTRDAIYNFIMEFPNFFKELPNDFVFPEYYVHNFHNFIHDFLNDDMKYSICRELCHLPVPEGQEKSNGEKFIDYYFSLYPDFQKYMYSIITSMLKRKMEKPEEQ